MREPRRSAFGLLFELLGADQMSRLDLPTIRAFSGVETANLRRMAEVSLNCPQTSSAGRLFDAVASITGICQRSGFEGQAAMRLQNAAEASKCSDTYEFDLSTEQEPNTLDWGMMIQQIIGDMEQSESVETIAMKFHQTLANMILAVAERVGEKHVALSGGCFQNRLLTELTIARLRANGFEPYWQQRIPCNDGGIAIGQLYSAVVCKSEER